jgi:cobaltochelatase CobN
VTCDRAENAATVVPAEPSGAPSRLDVEAARLRTGCARTAPAIDPAIGRLPRHPVFRGPAMSIFSRTRDIIAANFNELLDKADDPAKMIRLMIVEMEETLVEVRSASARTIADQKELRRHVARLERLQADWGDKAALALSKDREDLARAALMERTRAAEMAEQLRGEILATVRATALDRELNLQLSADPDSWLPQLDAYLCDLKESQIRDGLHVFGESPSGRLRRDTLLALLRVPRGDGQGGNASLLRALAADLCLGWDPLAGDPGETWSGPRPDCLADLCADVWRTAGDTRERLELLALQLIDGALAAPGAASAAVLAELHERVAPLLDACGAAEIAGLLAALDGRFVPPGPSGAPSRGRLDVLPTGRNFYAVDVRNLPTPTAWRLGFQSASLLLERHLQDHGEHLTRLGLSVWGTATMRTGGDDIAQAMALLGVRPVWQAGSGRVEDFEILPVSLLDRPRVDVTLRVSGFFRDAFANLLRLFDAAVQAVAALDEPEELNPLAARVRRESAELAAEGLSAEEARRRAAWRVFGAAPGGYGTGVQQAIAEGAWDSRADLADVYLTWGGYAYGAGGDGVPARAALERRLGAVQAVLHNQDKGEHDLLDSNDYYQFQGGMLAAAETLGGAQVASYHGDHSQPDNPRIRTLKEELNRVVRARAANPKWIAGIKRHGYKGAFELAATVDYLCAFDATSELIDDHQYEMLTDAYLLDADTREFVRQHNPAALREMTERLLDAQQRGLWQQPGEYRAALENLLLDCEEDG